MMDITSSQLREHDTWRAPVYNITSDHACRLLSQTKLDPDRDFEHNFVRKALWCADGSSALLQCENRSFQLIHASPDELGLTLSHALTLRQPSPIVDFLWYPSASRHNPATYCFVASVRECPVKLLDGNDGRLRASYPIVDHRERQIAPHSLLFNLTADRLYCGFQDAIEIFDVHRPGEGERLHTRPSKKSKEGLKGIVSALSLSPTGTYFAAGTLTPASPAADNIALYDVSDNMQVLSVGGIRTRESGGVVQLMFSPTDEHSLYAAFRRSPCVWTWDLRNASTPVCRFGPVPIGGTPESNDWNYDTDVLRYDQTNQKIHFDIECGGRWMGRGNQVGNIEIYDLHANHQLAETTMGEMSGFRTENSSVNVIQPIQEFKAHADAIGSVTFYPVQPALLSVSGSRHFDAKAIPYVSSTRSEGNVHSDSDSDSDLALDSDEGAQCWQQPCGVIERRRQPKNRPHPTWLSSTLAN
ncbi:hypothetical protein EDC04DRAFT_2878535 [Pisolithus marmoratus]|nr:hypothetical protein EDC04DRAFT_2878535 [Pisolithus marmoratus]